MDLKTSSAVPPIGRLSRAALQTCICLAPLPAQGYAPDATAIAAIGQRAAGLEIIVFVGTWCPDCRREVPRFFRIMDEAGMREAQVAFCCLDRSLRDPEGLAAHWNVTCVPTFILISDGRELGRVLDKPAPSLESEMARILAGN